LVYRKKLGLNKIEAPPKLQIIGASTFHFVSYWNMASEMIRLLVANFAQRCRDAKGHRLHQKPIKEA